MGLRMTKKQVETEVKYRIEEPKNKQKVLERYQQVRSVKQTDYYLNPPEKDFSQDRINYLRIRLREDGGSFDFHIVRNDEDTEEYETDIEDPQELKDILEKVGFEIYVEVRKQRKVFEIEGFEVTLDRINDIGGFVEIETTAEDSDRNKMYEIAEKLSLKENQKVTGKGYPDIVLEEQK